MKTTDLATSFAPLSPRRLPTNYFCSSFP